MSVAPDELHAAIDALPDDQVAEMLADVRRHNTPQARRTAEPFGWIGMIEHGPRDASAPQTVDKVLSQGFGR